MSRRLTGSVLLVLGFSVGASAQTSPGTSEPPVIVAQGMSLIQRPADIAWVQIGVEARGSKSEDASQRAAEAMTAVLAALRRSVAQDHIKTSAYSVTAEMEYLAGSPRVKGYVARNRVEVRVEDLAKLPTIMDASVSSGAATVSGLRFDLKARAELEREALRLAVQDALLRAQAIATGAGKTLGAIVRIQEQRNSAPPVATSFADGGAAGRGGSAAPPPPVVSGDIDIRATTTLTVAIK